MKQWFLVAALLCAGCSSTLLQKQVILPLAAKNTEGMLNPTRKVNELLIQRLEICSKPADVLEKQITRIDISTARVKSGEVDETKLDALLLASCRPARTPGVLNQLLADLTAAGTWPEDYAAFFDLLIAAQRAYASVEKVYLDLEKTHHNLRLEHEKMIQGLSEIEARIEWQAGHSVP